MTDREQIKTEIRRVNEILRNKPNPRQYRQNKAYLKRLERELKRYE